jgi:hypothetical protein
LEKLSRFRLTSAADWRERTGRYLMLLIYKQLAIQTAATDRPS